MLEDLDRHFEKSMKTFFLLETGTVAVRHSYRDSVGHARVTEGTHEVESFGALIGAFVVHDHVERVVSGALYLDSAFACAVPLAVVSCYEYSPCILRKSHSVLGARGRFWRLIRASAGAVETY